MSEQKNVCEINAIESAILTIRGQRVMLSADLANLYEVEPKVLMQAVKRNAKRFPEDFVFMLAPQEVANLKSQIVTSSWGGIRRARPYAFTEQGVAMLSGVLNSPRAVQVNIAIMRAFVKLRYILSTHTDLAHKLDELEKKYDGQFRVVFEALRQLMVKPETSRKQIGYGVREKRAIYMGTTGCGFCIAGSGMSGGGTMEHWTEDLTAEQREKIEIMLNEESVSIQG